MKNSLFIFLLFAAGCVLPETRTTVVAQHIFSQEDTSFYFSDCVIKSRSDSFELATKASEMKLLNGTNLSKADNDEIRLLYWAMDQPYCLIELRKGGEIIFSELEYSDDYYEGKFDTLPHLTADKNGVNKYIRYVNAMSYYNDCPAEKRRDYLNKLEAQKRDLPDSELIWHLESEIRISRQDTVNVLKTTLYCQEPMLPKFFAKFDTSMFWQAEFDRRGGASDGDMLFIEIKSKGRHYAVHRGDDLFYNAENEDKLLAEVCHYLLDKSGVLTRQRKIRLEVMKKRKLWPWP